MTKQQLEARNSELVRICDKETERADKAEKLIRELYKAIANDDWQKLCINDADAIADIVAKFK
jgi:hypothetical protein